MISKRHGRIMNKKIRNAIGVSRQQWIQICERGRGGRTLASTECTPIMGALKYGSFCLFSCKGGAKSYGENVNSPTCSRQTALT